MCSAKGFIIDCVMYLPLAFWMKNALTKAKAKVFFLLSHFPFGHIHLAFRLFSFFLRGCEFQVRVSKIDVTWLEITIENCSIRLCVCLKFSIFIRWFGFKHHFNAYLDSHLNESRQSKCSYPSSKWEKKFK